MGILTYISDDGFNPRKYILKLDLTKFNEEEKEAVISYFEEADGKVEIETDAEGKVHSYMRYTHIQRNEINTEIFIEVSVPSQLIQDMEAILREMIETQPMTFIYKEDEDDTEYIDDIETELTTIIWGEGYLYSLDQERCRKLFINNGNELKSERIAHIEKVYDKIKKMFKEDYIPTQKGLTAWQKVLLYDYFKKVYKLDQLEYVAENVILTLGMGVYSSAARKYNTPDQIKLLKTQENIQALLDFTRSISIEPASKKRHELLLERLENDLSS
jgi:hypothetical protein